MINNDGFILFVDFYKAFDSRTLIHFDALRKFGFGNYFSAAIRNNSNSSVKLVGGTSHRFDISRGIRQGCLVYS